MIISEQQIFELMNDSRAYGHILMQIGDFEDEVAKIAALHREIKDQQPTELKEIK